MSTHRHPVFFDNSGQRWKKVIRIIWGIVLAFSTVGAVFSFSLLVLPASKLSMEKSSFSYGHSPIKFENRDEAERRFLANRSRNKLLKQIHVDSINKKQDSLHRKRPAPYSTVIGFYQNWSQSGFNSLENHIRALSYVTPAWLGLPADGKLTKDGQHFINRFDVKGDDPQVVKLSKDNNVPIMPMIDNADKGQFWWPRLRNLLKSSKAQDDLIYSLRDYLLKNHFAGINIDFEPPVLDSQLSETEKKEAKQLFHEALPQFMGRLSAVFHKSHLVVSQDVPAANDLINYEATDDVNDYVVVMLYDQHTTGRNAGPIASQAWIEEVAQNLFDKMDTSKVILGIGNYCYDWPVEHDKNGEIPTDSNGEFKFFGTGTAKLSVGEAWVAADQSEATIEMDEGDLNPYFTYVDSRDKAHPDHIIYLLDAVTAYNQITALKGYHPGGAALWALGSEDPAIWNFFDESKLGKPVSMSDLETIPSPSGPNVPAKLGEILQIISSDRKGERKLVFDEDGIVSSESFTQYPSPPHLGHYGAAEHKIAITFDDGPNPEYTPKILKILKENHVPATFFVVGENAERYPDIVRECWEANCEIGNHTYTHPNMGTEEQKDKKGSEFRRRSTTNLRFNLELNATQRTIESIIGHSTRLFRPPYGVGADVAPSPEDAWIIQLAQDRGYLTVGMNIDPNDWKLSGKDGASLIVKAVEKDADKGHILLLHDGGGNRDQTIIALPMIIKRLKAMGYQLVTVSDLLGPNQKKRIFPTVTHHQEAIAGIDRVFFESDFIVRSVLQFFFLIAIILGVARVLAVTPLALFQARKAKKLQASGYAPPVTVIIPSYNEDKVIARTIDAVLNSDYPDLRVIVIDDGSTDDTAAIVQREYGSEPRVTFIRKENGGKSTALNLGISMADTDIIICLDADTLFRYDTISRLVPHFADPKVGAVAGNVKVGNRFNPITIWQSLEYITSQNFDRRAYAALNAVSVVPGAVGAWRKSAVEAAGGYETDTLAEDTDLTFRVLLLGYDIRTENSAIAYTEAPDTIRTLAKQRFRWAFGTLQSLWKHRRVLLKPKHGAFSMFVMPAMWLYNIFFQAFSPIVDIAVLFSLFSKQYPAVLTYYAAFFVLDFFGALLALELDGEDPKQLLWLFWQRFFYRQFMYFIIIKAIIAALRGGIIGWGKLQRKANVSVAEVAQK